MPKCEFPGGIVIKPDGVNELDPCVYQEVERYRNVTVIISRCVHCGATDISWERQPDTELVEPDDE